MNKKLRLEILERGYNKGGLTGREMIEMTNLQKELKQGEENEKTKKRSL